MAFTIIRESGAGAKQVIAQERYVVTIDGARLVEAGESGTLLAAPGQSIPERVAAKLGIGPDGRRLAPKPAHPIPETKVILPDLADAIVAEVKKSKKRGSAK